MCWLGLEGIGGCGCDCWLGRRQREPNPTRGLHSGGATSWSCGQQGVTQHRGHTGVGQGRTRDDGLRGAMCCVSLGGRILLAAQGMWHVGGGGFRWPERPGGGCLLACLCAWSLATEDLLGCIRIWECTCSGKPAGIGRSGLGVGGPMAGGGVVAPADGSGRDTAQQIHSTV